MGAVGAGVGARLWVQTLVGSEVPTPAPVVASTTHLDSPVSALNKYSAFFFSLNLRSHGITLAE
jgi:hypothetical protein